MKEVLSGKMESSKNKLKKVNIFEFKSLKKIIMLMKIKK